MLAEMGAGNNSGFNLRKEGMFLRDRRTAGSSVLAVSPFG